METQIIFQLLLATFLGALVGLEREIKKREAGFKTYSLVSLGSCLFTLVSFELLNAFLPNPNVGFDPSTIINAIAIGIGFIGGGVILHQGGGVQGLTTAAGMWVASAIGIAVAVKMYYVAGFATLLAILILTIFGLAEEKFVRKL